MMTIHPPRFAIDKNEPFKDALFGREEFAKSLISILRNVSDNLVVFINAPWGAGKTTFAGMLRGELEGKQKLDVIYFDAYAADYFDDPFISFSGEILDLVDRRLSGDKGLIERREFKKTAVEVGKRLVGLTAKIGLRAATINLINATDLGELKDLGSDVASNVADVGAEVIEKRIEDYSTEKDALRAFKKSLAALAKKVRDEQGFPLTIIVDELDRCRPDFALRLLERIKHLFDVEGVAFVLLVNREQIENYIRTVYGDMVDSQSYLLKFGSLFVDLPIGQPQFASRYISGYPEYIKKLFNHFGLQNRIPNSQLFMEISAALSIHFEVTLREIEKLYANLVVYYGGEPHYYADNIAFVLILSFIKIKDPDTFSELKAGQISLSEFLVKTKIKNIQSSNTSIWSREWVVRMLTCCLADDAELEQTIKNDHQLQKLFEEFGRDRRRKVIPALCESLDRFQLRS